MTFLEKYFKSLLYIQISPQRITLRNPVNGMAISEAPCIAIVTHPKEKVLGVGADAALAAGVPGARLINPFGHPRSMVSDFAVAEQLLKIYVARIRAGFNFFRTNPTIVMHLLGDHEGGLTQVERRAFRELALGAGAAKVVIYTGPELSDAQLMAGEFPNDPG
jgi:rod shape-determining protein MreB